MGRKKKEDSSGYVSKQIDQDVFNRIIYRMSNGETLTRICKEDDQPDYCVFINWVMDDIDLYKKYARARQIQADYFADDIVAISDTEADQARSRNRMDARRWHAAKLAPRKYGERVMNDINANVTTTSKLDLSNLDSEARRKLRQVLIEQMRGEQTIEDVQYKVDQR